MNAIVGNRRNGFFVPPAMRDNMDVVPVAIYEAGVKVPMPGPCTQWLCTQWLCKQWLCKQWLCKQCSIEGGGGEKS
jgi:hypothetical protein